MRVAKTLEKPKQEAAPKPRVVVTEINGKLMAFVVDPAGPVVRIPLGDLEAPTEALG
jgi:chemotaxis signal transduction protein